MNDTILLGCCFAATALLALIAALSTSDRWPVGKASGTIVALCGCIAAGFAAGYAKHGVVQALPGIIALACATVCSATDLKSGYVFDRVTYPSAIVIVLVAAMGGTGWDAAAGGAVAAAVIVVLWMATLRRGIGLGDAKLAAIVGAGVGPVCALPAIGLAFVLGAIAACAALLTHRCTRRSTVAFAPYLAAAFAVVLVVKELHA